MTPSVSRRSSEDSVQGQRAILKPPQGDGHGNVLPKEKGTDHFSGSPPITKAVFRHSNLREAG